LQSPRGADAGRGRGRRRAYQNHPHAPRNESQTQNQDVSEAEASAEEQAVAELRQELENVSVTKVEEAPAPVEDVREISAAKVDNSSSLAASAIPDMRMMSPVRPTTAAVSDNIVGSPVLKMGRWGAPIESTDGSSFQFGSFGNLGEAASTEGDGDESPHKIASGLISSLSEPQTSWGQQPQLDQNPLSQSDRESEAVSASLSVWGSSQPQNDAPDDGYGYDQQVSNTGNDNAPPGLGLGLGGLDASTVVSQSNSNKSANNNRNSNRSAPGSQTRKSEMDNNMSRQPQQYYQQMPPGIQGGFGGMPYYGFDMNLQPPATGYGATAQGNSSPAPAAPPGNPAPASNAAANAANQNGSNYNANANNAPKYPGPPGMPAQMGAPYPPYYGNPYYQQAFYYGGGQPQNFYGRGGQGMYPPRPYGGDPYAPGMGGYDMYGQPGQFGDGVYGQMPMPQQMHPQQGGGGNERQGGKGNKNSAGQNAQSAGAVGSAPSSNPGQAGQGDANQALHAGYGMGGYNAYGRPDQGSGWGPYQPGWGGMMPFPAAPTGLGGGYSQMGGAPAQPGNNRQQGGGSYNTYGRGGGSAGNGAGDPSSGIGSTGTGTTSTW
jgi:hypothetical protein